MSPSQSSECDEVYEVESIEKKKIDNHGKVSYFIKWKDYDSSENTWEPFENLDCTDLIEEFEKRKDKIVEDDESRKKKKNASTKITNSQKKSSTTSRPPQPATTNVQSKTGFDEGLTVDRILGATDAAGELMFLIKWKERNEASLISSSLAKAKCPQQLIAYLETKITFVSEETIEEISS